MSSKVYVVEEFGGQYEDSWSHIVGVCTSSELADKLKAKIEESHNKSCKITEEEWHNIMQTIDDWEEDHLEFDTIINGVKFLFPDQYTDKDIQEALDKYGGYDDYCGVFIQEVPYYTNITELEQWTFPWKNF